MDLRTQKTYQGLCEAFLKLLEIYRFEDISIQQLCDEAKIRRATFYSHFTDKYDFLSFFIKTMRKEFLSNFSVSSQDNFKSYYLQSFHELISFFKSHPKLIENLKHSQALPALIDLMTEEIQQNLQDYLKQEEKGKSEIYYQMKASFYAGGILQIIRLWMMDPSQVDMNQMDWLD